MTDSAIQLELDKHGIATVTLNRPAKHNAFDDTIIAALTQTFRSLRANTEVRALVLAAKGKSFSAGADLSWMKRMANFNYDENLEDARALAAMLGELNTLPFPTIARIQGAAFGGAVGLISCCDLAVGTPKASFSLSEVKIGLIPATIGPYVVAAIGQRAARRYFQTAERFTADTALQLGLLTRIAAEAALDAEVKKLLATLLANSPQAVCAAKQLVFDVANRPITETLTEETCKKIAKIRVSDEGQEGLSAFLDKRAPAWQTSLEE